MDNFSYKEKRIKSILIKGVKSSGWKWISRFSDIGGIVAFIILIIGRLGITAKLDSIESKIDNDAAQETIMKYFSNIEDGNLTGAYNLLSDEFKEGNNYEGFYNRLHDVVGFEGLKITPLSGKNTAIQKVYLVEFDLKFRGKIPLPSKRGMYMRFKNGKWEINSNSILYENGRSSTACKFYLFDHC